jgi:hypothetical protein
VLPRSPDSSSITEEPVSLLKNILNHRHEKTYLQFTD